jgi:hypothetical protein
MKALFLDDMDQRHKSFHNKFGDQFETTHVYGFGEFITAMTNDDYDILFLDHDLSETAIMCDPDDIDERTGSDAAKWLVRYYADKDFKPGVVVHSMNPIGRKNMVSILKDGGIDAVPLAFYNLICNPITVKFNKPA